MRAEFIFAASDMGFCTNDVIHNSDTPEIPLWKFIRTAQIASTAATQAALHPG
jgi:hypothetical protein